MSKCSLFLDTRRAKDDSSYPVKLYINHKKRFYISTQICCSLENWKGNECSNRENNFKVKNVRLRNILNSVDSLFASLELTGKITTTTDKQLKELILSEISPASTNKHHEYFTDYLDKFISLKTNKGTILNYITTRNKIIEFDEHCTFETMTKEWLIRFENWMIGNGMKINAYSIHFRNIRAVFNYAIDEEYTTFYPFRKFQIKKEETRKRCITVEQLRELRDYPVEEFQERYRDIFMLIFYLRGINIGDLCLLRHSDLINGYIEYKRLKTGKQYSVKVEPEAKRIIKKYKGKDYLINVMDDYKDYTDFRSRINRALKKIGECKRTGRGGKKKITPLMDFLSTYWARHTWATLASQIAIPKEVISAALGHSSNSVTDIYIKFDNSRVDKANRRLIDFLNGKYKPKKNVI